MLAASFALKTVSRTVALRDCTPAMQQSDDYAAFKRGLVALADMFQKLAQNSAAAAQSTKGGAGQGMASGSGNDSRAIAGQEPTPISQLSDQDAQQHPGNARGEHQGQGTASSCAGHQDSEDDRTLLDSMTKVLPNFQNAPWRMGRRERTRYENVSLVGREFSERASTTPEPHTMRPRRLPQALVQAALNASPTIVQSTLPEASMTVDMQLRPPAFPAKASMKAALPPPPAGLRMASPLAAALAYMVKCEQKCEAARSVYDAKQRELEGARLVVLSLQGRECGEAQSKWPRTSE